MSSERRTLRHFGTRLLLGVNLLLVACLPDDKMKIAYNDQPRVRDDGWALSTPAAEGFDPEALRQVYRSFFAEDHFVTAISLLVVRHGKLVSEAYCRDLDDIDQLTAIQSATKSVTSILTGMAIDDGKLAGPGQRIYEIIPDAFDDDRAKRAINVGDLLTMQSGLDFPNKDFSREVLIDGQPDSLRYILHKPLLHDPGDEFDYQDATVHLLSGVLGKLLGEPLDKYARRRLFAPLGIEHQIWERYSDGVTYGGVGLYLVPRDLAKLGQLMLQQGSWQGEQIVSAEWVAESTRTHVESTSEEGFGYGYYWWRPEDLDAFTASGHGGQYFFVVPAQELVVVMTAEPHTVTENASIEFDEFKPLVERVIDAIVE